MSERSPEQQIREALLHFDVPYNRSLVREALAALDRLVAERDEALKEGENYAGYGELLEAAEGREAALREALRGVGNAFGCFAGCTAGVTHLYTATPAAFYDHSIACRQARAALAAAAVRTPGEAEAGRAE